MVLRRSAISSMDFLRMRLTRSSIFLLRAAKAALMMVLVGGLGAIVGVVPKSAAFGLRREVLNIFLTMVPQSASTTRGVFILDRSRGRWVYIRYFKKNTKKKKNIR